MEYFNGPYSAVMARVPPKLTPVLNLGRGNEQPDGEQPDNERPNTNQADDGQSGHEQSFPRSLQLPPEPRVMTCEKYMKSSGTPPSTHSQSALVRTLHLVRPEAPPLFYQHSTFAASINIWSRRNDQELSARLDRSSDDMLDDVPRQHRSSIKKIKLLLVFNLAVERRYEVTFDLTQWHDFARGVRFERVMPVDDTQYEEIFLRDIEVALGTMFEEVGKLNGGLDDCERVLAMTETAVDDVFFRRSVWLEFAYAEMMVGFVRKYL